ncbi:MAG: helix-turn-helix domain-containing protein [Chryseolinea sp.]
MSYTQFTPHTALANYIDAYWSVKGADRARTEKILPDGCMDIILNVQGSSTTNGPLRLVEDKVYLLGTMTKFIETKISANALIFGVRFKPAGFSHFYQNGPVHEITDNTVEFENSLAPDIREIINGGISYLNGFFFKRLCRPRHDLSEIICDVKKHRGNVAVNLLAKAHNISVRQLERRFKYYIGVSPKEFVNFVRYQAAFQQIKNNSSRRSLLDIAFESGYYDHSHLTNEFKRYAGVVPSKT